MSKSFHRIVVYIATVFAFALLWLALESKPATAQGFSFGGIKVDTDNKNGNQSGDDDDDNNNNGNNNSNRNGGRRSRSNNSNNSNSSSNGEDDDSNSQQFQQFFPGAQNGQNKNNRGQNGFNQDGANQFRRSGQQGQNWQNGQNGITIGTWNGGKWQGSNKVESWTKNFSGNNSQPFSNQWYKDHPKAWKDNNNKVDFWVGGSIPGVYSFLGWGNVPQQYRRYYGNVPQYDRSQFGEWYPLGVFSLMSGPGDPGTRIVQLAVDQNGRISGNYYDMITNSNFSLSGDLRQQSQRVSWSLNKNQYVRFRANLYELLQPYGSLTVQLPGGEQQWQFVRLEN